MSDYLSKARREARDLELESQLAARNRELAALNAISSILSRSLEMDKFLGDALRKTLELMEIEAGGIYLLQEDRLSLRIAAHYGLDEPFIAQIDNLLVGEGFSGRVVQNGEPVILGDLSADPRLTRSVVGQRGFHALAVFPLISRGQPLGTIFMITRQFHQFSYEDIELVTIISGQIGVAIENARLFSAEQRRAEQLHVLAGVGQRITSLLNIDEVLEQVVKLVQQTFGYYHVAIGMIEGDEVVYRVGTGVLWDDPGFQFKPGRLKVGMEGFSGWVAATGEPLLVPDVSQDSRYVWMQGSQCRSELTVPIMVKGKIIGVLDAQSDQLNDFDDIDVELMKLLAAQAGVAIENARLYEQARQVAVLEERQRLARELHDSVTQALYGMTLYSQAASGQLALGDLKQVAINVQEIQDTAQEALAEMRLLIYELRPPMLEKEGLVAALQARLSAVEGRAGLKTTLKTELTGRLSPAVEEGLYRIAQEALNNALKHARASDIIVYLRQDGELVILEIIDDGVGFEPSAKLDQGGMGLAAMRERTDDLGGIFTLTSKPGEGTRLLVEVRT